MKQQAYMVDRPGGAPESFSPFHRPIVMASSEQEAKAKFLVWYEKTRGCEYGYPADLIVCKLEVVE